jgi:2-aminobenzoate-CoA ligase
MSGHSAHHDSFTADSLPPKDEWPELLLGDLHYPEILNAGVELVEGAIEKVGSEKIALIGPEGEFTYGEMRAEVRRRANFLVGEGVLPGNRVLLRGPNNASIVMWWLAILRVGGVAVTTIALQRHSELEKIVDIAHVQFALIDHRFTEEWYLASNFHGRTFIYGGGSNDHADSRARDLPDDHQPVATSQDDVALLAFTSGSTGIPKATMHFHRDILAIADTFSAKVVKPRSDDRFTGSPPIAFTFGLGGLVIFPLRIGATAVLFESLTPPQLLDKLAEYKITCLFTAPTAYRAMLHTVTPEKVATLRRCVSAGEHLPKSTWQSWFEKTGIKLIDGIGSTEMLHIFISASDDDIVPGMTGRAVPGYYATVIDENFHELPAGEIGRLAVKGPTGCRYLNDSRQQNYVVNGWNLTGDLYLKDENGYFQYQSRSDDMIISSGYNIAAPEVENAILTHPAVLETAVVGLPDEERGMVVTAYIVLKDKSTGSADLTKEIQDHVKREIAPFKYPRVIHFVESLPKTTTGKLQRFRLKSETK